jgi:hypothetical protein
MRRRIQKAARKNQVPDELGARDSFDINMSRVNLQPTCNIVGFSAT